MTVRLLDTDVCIEILRGHDPAAEPRVRAMPELAVTTGTVAELTFGAARSRDPERDQDEVARFVAALDVIPLDGGAALEAGRIRAVLAAAGTPIGGYDVLIAGTALARDLILVTGNTRELGRVPGLRLEAW